MTLCQNASQTVPDRRVSRPCSSLTLIVALVATPWLSAVAQAETVMRAEDIVPFSVTYTVGNNLLSAGNATLELSKVNDETWQYQLETKPTGVFKLTGKGNITETSLLNFEAGPDDGLLMRPQQYTYRQDEERRRAVDATFDWAGENLLWTRRGESDSSPLSDKPVIDRLSVTLAVMSALRQGIPKSEYHVFDNGRLKDVIFESQGNELLETSIGPLETVRVLRSNAEGSSRTTMTWFAPSLDFIPVKIEQLKRGELVARLTLKSLKNRAVELDEPLIKPEAPVAD